MKICTLLFGTFVFVAHADVIVMKNGDRVTGSVVKKDAATLTIKSVHFGTVTLPWDQVDTLTTENPINAELANGQTIQGRITTANGKLEIGNQTVAPADLTALRDAAEQANYERLLNPSWLQLWAGNATIAWAGTAGNAQTSTFTIGANATRQTKVDLTSLHFNTIKSSALASGTKQDTAEAVRGGVVYNRNLSSRVFFNGFNDWEYDRFQSLDLRLVVGGGAGYHVWKREADRLDILGGFSWNRSTFDPLTQPKFTRNVGEAFWGDDFAYRFNSRINLTQEFRMFNNLSDTGQYRVNFDLGANTQLLKWLSWNIVFSDRYLSNPVQGRKTNDFLYSTGVGITFAH